MADHVDRPKPMRRARRVGQAVIALLGSILAAGACTEPVEDSGWMVSVDTTAGVVRVTNVPPRGGASPTLAGDEEFRIGSASGVGEDSFGMIRTIAILEDGGIAVADAQAEEVRLFDREGTYLRTFGGKGAGPGEFDGMQGVYLDQAGLLRVPELGNGRISIFDPEEGLVGTHPLRLFSYRGSGPWEAAFDSVGRTLVASSGEFGAGRYWRMLRIYDSSMTQVDSIPYDEYTDDVEREDYPGVWVIAMGNGGRAFIPVPYYPQPQETLSPTGEFWTSPEGKTQLEVVRWTAPGDTSLVFYGGRAPLPVADAERDSAVAATAERLPDGMRGAAKLDPSKVPAVKPPLYSLSLDGQGRVWARITEPGLDSTVYDVFDRDGRHVETVSLPLRVDDWIPPISRGDTLWTVVRDEMDVQYVARVRLRAAR